MECLTHWQAVLLEEASDLLASSTPEQGVLDGMSDSLASSTPGRGIRLTDKQYS